MTDWRQDQQKLLAYFERLRGQATQLEAELNRLLNTLEVDVALARSRKTLELIVYELHRTVLRKTPSRKEPLENLINQLRDPLDNERLLNAMHTVRATGNRGAHAATEAHHDVDPREVQLALTALSLLLEWYVEDYQRLLQGSAADATRPLALCGLNPYRGLDAFQEMDADRFFGRERYVRKTLWDAFTALEANPPRLLALVGPSGSGKSSLARAGLLPHLKRQRPELQCLVLTPTHHPLEALARTLADWLEPDNPLPTARTDELLARLRSGPDGLRRLADDLHARQGRPLLLLIDQFEETWSLCRDPRERQTYLDALLEAATAPTAQVYLLLTLRSDFLGDTQGHPAFNQVVASRLQLVPVLDDDGLRRAIAEPARQAGHPLDAAVVQLLLEQSAGREGALPLLQFALGEIWRGLREGVPAADTLRRVGGVGGALAGKADALYGGLNTHQQAMAQRIFMKMVQLGEGGPDTRRQVALADLLARDQDPAELRAVLDFFAGSQARLLTLGTTADPRAPAEEQDIHVSITHDALITHWQRLRDWLAEHREDLRLWQRLDAAAKHWHQQGRPTGLLWRRPDLDLMLALSQRQGAGFTALQDDFSRSTLRHHHLRVWLIRGVAASLVVLTLSAGLSAWLAQKQTIKARQQGALMAPLSAERLTKSGNLDGALLVLMDAIDAFKGHELPDQVRIGAHQVLEQAARTTQYELGTEALLLKADGGFYLVEKKTGRLYWFDATRKPQYHSTIPLPPERTIEAARFLPGRVEIAVVDSVLQAHGYDLATSRITRSAQVPTPTLPTNRPVTRVIHIEEDGLIVAQWIIEEKFDELNKKTIGLGLLDFHLEASYAGNPDVEVSSSLKVVGDKDRYLADMDYGGYIKKLIIKDGAIFLQSEEKKISADTIRLLRCRANFVSLSSGQTKTIKKILEGGATLEPFCKPLGNDLFFSYYTSGSAGVFRTGIVISESGDTCDSWVAELDNDNVCGNDGHIDMPLFNNDAVDLIAGPDGNHIAVADNRHVSVFFNIFGQSFDPLDELWHETTPDQVNFLVYDRLLAFEKDKGRITLHNLEGSPFRQKVLESLPSNKEFVLNDPLHVGTCTGATMGSARLIAELTLKDHAKLGFTADPMQIDSERQLAYTDIQQNIHYISLPSETLCLQFSDDLHRLILVTETQVDVYNLDKVLASKKLDGTLVATIPGRSITAFPLADGSIVVSKGSTEVERWSLDRNGKPQSTVIYQGQYPIEYAEPDYAGQRLLLVEDSGGRELRAFLYSIPASSEYATFDQGYKWTALAFDKKGRIAFGSRILEYLFQPSVSAAELIEELRAELSDRCSIPQSTSVRESPCWKELNW